MADKTLVEWLLDQLAADADVAERESRWPNGQLKSADDWRQVAGTADSMLVGLCSPARVLADIDAKRQIIAEHHELHRDIGWLDGDEASDELPVCGCCVPKHSRFRTRADVPIYPCRTVRLLALPYTGRDGYTGDDC